MNTIQILLIALILDYLIGDPNKVWSKIPHPAVIMGKLISWFDYNFNFGSALKFKGIFAIFSLSIMACLIGQFIHLLPDYGLIELLITAILLAHNSLVKHVKDVLIGLNNSLNEGRNAVACIVGRQTKNLDESNVSRAAVLTNQDDYTKTRNYWKYLKAKLKRENNQLVSMTTPLKIIVADVRKCCFLLEVINLKVTTDRYSRWAFILFDVFAELGLCFFKFFLCHYLTIL